MFRHFKEKLTVGRGLSERIWIYQAKRGNREAFGKLYEKHIDGIYRYLYFRLNQDRFTAEDLVQTVFFKAWENITKFAGGNFSAWLFSIAHNQLIDYYKKAKAIVYLQTEVEDRKENLEERVIQNDKLERLKKAIGSLTDEQKAVITLRFIEGLNHRLVGQILKKEERAVRAIQYRALKQLRKILEEG